MMKIFLPLIFVMLMGLLAFDIYSSGPEKIPGAVLKLLPPETRLISYYKDDMNGDGTEDYILFYERLNVSMDEYEQHRQIISIITRDEDGKYTLAKTNERFISCRICNVPEDGPYQTMMVIQGNPRFYFAGDGDYKYHQEYTFEYSPADKTWFLSHVKIMDEYPDCGGKKIPAEECKTATKTEEYTPKDFGKMDFANFDGQDMFDELNRRKK